MIRFVLLLMLSGVLTKQVLSQRECVATDYNKIQIMQNPALAAKQQAIAEFLRRGQETTMFGVQDNPTEQTVINIPVVVHVLYNPANQNIPDAQILSQLEILNNDFRHKNADSVKTPGYFRALAADCRINFTLATIDPRGQPTNGIIRKKTNATGFDMGDDIKFSSKGGDDAWDSDKYLNIWVAAMQAGIVGYSSAPGSDKNRDGVVVRFNAFGSTGAAIAPYNRGRTLVHEVGHWLGLIHIWGDLLCGDDLINDTPPQQSYTRGCPGGAANVSCGNGPNGDMYMNFMDLTEDACTNMFTLEQRSRMRALFNDGGPRHNLLFSNGSGGSVQPPVDIPLPGFSDKKPRLFPNPAKNTVNLDFGGDETLVGQYVSVYNQYGQMMQYKVITGNQMKLQIGALSTGVYFVKIGTDKNTLRLLKISY
jgi:hypothetical protein